MLEHKNNDDGIPENSWYKHKCLELIPQGLKQKIRKI
jgi:hypothetical protein